MPANDITKANLGSYKGAKASVLTLLLIVFGASLFFSAYYTIESGTVGVLSTFGEYAEDESEPGLHFKVPLFQKVHVFDVKLQTVNYHGRKDAPDEPGVINKPQIEVLDDKNLRIGMDVTIQFTPDKSRANEILAKFGKNYFEKRLNAIIRTIIRDIAGNYQAESIATERAELGKTFRAELIKAFETLPFMVNEVAIRNIVLPKIVTDKIEQVQQAKQEEQRLAMVKKQADQDQLIKQTQAQTRLIEITTKAKADAEKRKIEADAKAYAVLKEAEAIAKANTMIAKSLTPELVQYKGLEIWNGVMPTTLLGNEGISTLISVPGKQ